MGVQSDDGISAFYLNESGDLPRLNGLQRPDDLRGQLVRRYGLVVTHIHAKIVFGDLFRQQTELLIALRRFGLAQRFLSLGASLLRLFGGSLQRRYYGNALEREGLRLTEASSVLDVISLQFGRRYRRPDFHIRLQHLLDEQRAPNLLA